MIFSSTNRKFIIGASILNEGSDAIFYAFVFLYHAKTQLDILGEFAFLMAIINFAKFFDFGIVNSLSSIVANNLNDEHHLRRIIFLAFSISNVMYAMFLSVVIVVMISLYNLSALEFGYAFILALLTLNVSLISSIFDGFKQSITKNAVSFIVVIICIPITLTFNFEDQINQILFSFIILVCLKFSFLISAYLYMGLTRPMVCLDLRQVREFIGVTVSIQITSLLSAFLNPFLKIVIGPSNYVLLGAVELALQIVMRLRKFINVYTRTLIPYLVDMHDYRKIQSLNYKLSFVCMFLLLILQLVFIEQYETYGQNIDMMQIIFCAWLYNVNCIAPFYRNIALLRPKQNLIAYTLIFMIFAIPSIGNMINIWQIQDKLIIMIYSSAILIGSIYLVLREMKLNLVWSMLKRELLLVCIALLILYVNI